MAECMACNDQRWLHSCHASTRVSGRPRHMAKHCRWRRRCHQCNPAAGNPPATFEHHGRTWLTDPEGLRPGGWWWGRVAADEWLPLRFPTNGSLTMVRAMQKAGRVAIKPESFVRGDLVEARDGERTLCGIVDVPGENPSCCWVEIAGERSLFQRSELTLVKPAHTAPNFDAQAEALKSALWERRERRDV